MEKVSEFISKKVISIEDGNLIGYVLNIMFDDQLKIFDGLIVVDEESENTFFLHRKDIVSIGQDCVMIDNANHLQFNISSSNNPIGKLVYDCQGNMLGKVVDVELIGKQVKKIITTKCEFPQKYIRKAGDNFIIYGLASKKKKENLSNHNHTSLINPDGLPIVSIASPSQSHENETTPRLFANSNCLLGKMVSNDILGLNNELIAKKFDIIDKKIINKAKKHNKLNLLAYYCK